MYLSVPPPTWSSTQQKQMQAHTEDFMPHHSPRAAFFQILDTAVKFITEYSL